MSVTVSVVEDTPGIRESLTEVVRLAPDVECFWPLLV
jgi:hypothetical protein